MVRWCIKYLQTRNAVFEGYHLVAGVGATMVLSVAVEALAKKILARCTQDCPEKVDVFAQRPYYTGYAMLDLPTAQWNPDADPRSPWTIEFNTSVRYFYMHGAWVYFQLGVAIYS